MFMALATIAWLSLVLGWFSRKRRHWHLPLVLNGMFLDITLVCYLEYDRHALGSAFSFKLEPLAQLHILASSVACLLYLPVFWLGSRLFYAPGDQVLRARHRNLAQLALGFRTLGFVLMFSMWK